MSAANPSPEPLRPLEFPLHGSRLIEASAGTGKTFTIAMLYLRLVLGHGGEQGFSRALTPPEILVVTFTEAATQELRERIRARLAEAADCFRADPGSVPERPAGEDLLHDLRAGYDPSAWPGCARRLQLAAEWMDEAAVSTIHGWCNRMLREHAFDSNSLFTQRLETDQRDLLADAVRDHWRSFIAPLADAEAAELRRHWSGPQELQQAIAPLLAHAALLPDAPEPRESLCEAADARRRRLAELKSSWTEWADQVEALLDAAVAAKRVDGRKLRKGYYGAWLAQLRGWAADPLQADPGLSDSALNRLSDQGLAEAWKDGAPPDALVAHPALAALSALPGELAALPDARDALLAHAARWVAARFRSEQQRRAQMGFDDLLTRLAAALEGESGARLAETIRRQFPVALIDEFQDTDPVQYRIFDAVYRVERNDTERALVLIGDPKQAIYAFRGADIHTYLQARRACGDRIYTLRRNFRSSQAMVDAVNHLFAQAEQASGGPGAFLFRSAAGNPVPFLRAEAAGCPDAWSVQRSRPAALTLWQLESEDQTMTKGDYRDRIARSCASEIARLLQLAQGGECGFERDDQLVALAPADIAVLVSDRNEADAIRSELSRRGVRSVYLSERESVYNSPQAVELQLWLQACAEPDDARRLRAALATATLALDWAELDALQHDELAWEARVLQFRGYRDAWRRQGVLPMLRALLHDFDVPARLLAQRADASGRSGERVLTDLLHLAELLQQASVLLDSEHALLRHLAEQREQAGQGAQADALQLRLESDAELVQVITIHKSKGLEYPLVFLPFAASCRPARPDDLPLKWHDEQGRLRLALSADDEALQCADRERLGEDLRKLYVALTRARHATWIGIAALEDLPRSALGHLLGRGQSLAPDGLADALQRAASDCEAVALLPAPEPTLQRYQPPARGLAELHARTLPEARREPWWIASYSALQRFDGPLSDDDAAAQSASEEVFRETPAALSEPADPSGAGGTLHDFVRGKEAGTLLHDLLEWTARQGFGFVAANDALLREQVERRCAPRGWTRWVEPLTEAIGRLLEQPLALDRLGEAQPLQLRALRELQPELEFWFGAERVDAVALDALVRRHTLRGEARAALQPARLNGMLKGYVDLVFEHRGRYYLADYKSNRLGADDSAYTEAALRASVLKERYELQYSLYLLALHRLLRSRLPDYDYQRDVGGVVYVYLRGLAGPCQGLHLEKPPFALIDALDRLFAGADQESR